MEVERPRESWSWDLGAVRNSDLRLGFGRSPSFAYSANSERGVDLDSARSLPALAYLLWGLALSHSCTRKRRGFYFGQNWNSLGLCGGFRIVTQTEVSTMRGILLWLIGIPIPIIILLWLFGVLH
jgi:hypothetical protein